MKQNMTTIPFDLELAKKINNGEYNGTLWDCCIPFEDNEYLLGTTENPEK